MSGNEGLLAKAPWYVSSVRTRHNAMPALQIISEPTAEVLALVPYSDRTPKAHAECYADARLIAAAPDLLEVARSASSLRGHDGEPTPIAKRARAAIAKAEAI